MPDVASALSPEPEIRQETAGDGGVRVVLAGTWNLKALARRLADISSRLRVLGAEPGADWDLTGIDRLDDAGAVLLWRAWGGHRPERLALRREHEMFFHHLAHAEHVPRRHRRAELMGMVVGLGRGVLLFADHVLGFVELLGRTVLDGWRVLFRPARWPWREISASVYRTGAQALGITALVGFLIGITLSYLTARQLKTIGGDIFIVDVLGFGIIRELGPVLAAVLVAGRSGSAMTAQIGVMRVTQELDAMAVLGIPETLRLVLPRVTALALSLPLLVLWTDAVAMLGGIVAADVQLGVGLEDFLRRLPDAVPMSNMWLGLIKGLVFGALIALVACHFGLRVKPNTESLGRGTTNSVVTSITLVIVVDAVFAVAFSHVGFR
ncbi:MAG TPA: ABC transporter permease [Burkholderiales bacterium]|nr:ABC transporter permease [Burkholderiales bacterium]